MTAISRRGFLVIGGAAGTGLILWFYLPHGGHGGAFAPNAYLRIAPDGKITVVVARSEMGQGVQTSLPMVLAEELEADWSQITIEQAGASTLFGDQTTGGSASVKTTWAPMRQAGAAAREMLISAAALEWGVPPSACRAEKGAVIYGTSNRRLTYGELAEKAAKLPVPVNPPLKSAKDFRLVGTRLPRTDTPSKVDGSAIYGIDVRLPGMKYALLARCPVIGGKLRGFDDAEARKVPGVSQVTKIGDSAVAVVADSVWGAMEGRRALNVIWDEGPNRNLNSAAISDSLHKAAGSKGVAFFTVGEVAKTSGRRIEAAYDLPFLAHAPMEPGNCTAHYRGSSCELWAPTQVPQAVRDSVAEAIKLDPSQVKVNVTLLGGGFGRRLEVDYGVEAALVSQAIGGPVQVLWTREDDMRHSFYRPASHHRLSAVLEDGVQMGPVINRESKARVESLIAQGETEGAKVVVDGRGARIAGCESGNFIRPTILSDVPPSSKLPQTEIFGPVLSLVNAESVDEALEILRASSYGNAASIFTTSGAAARKFRYEAPAGNIGVNIGVAAPMAYFPFSGWKDSFLGVLHGQGRDAVEFYTEKKVVIERWPKEWSRKF